MEEFMLDKQDIEELVCEELLDMFVNCYSTMKGTGIVDDVTASVIKEQNRGKAITRSVIRKHLESQITWEIIKYRGKKVQINGKK